MKEDHHAKSVGTVGPYRSPRPVKKKRHVRRAIGIILLIIIALVGVARLLLPSQLRKYVNRTLDRNQLYEGRIGDIEVHLFRGAYSIHDVKISQRTGNVPVPLLAAKVVDFSVQWNALIHGKMWANSRCKSRN
jgi:uncharacterized protein involved in outer membrane biogenesis